MRKISGDGGPSIDPIRQGTRPLQQPAGQDVRFSDLLSRQTQQQAAVRFSAHAAKRLAESHVALDTAQVKRLEDAVQKAAAKGARESLILMDNLALVVSIRNRTVITAVDGERMKQSVFTNIDSAVIT
jgi:flagellar operon protein